MVLHSHGAVVSRAGVHVALPVGRVEDVGESRLLQAVPIQRRFSGGTRAGM